MIQDKQQFDGDLVFLKGKNIKGISHLSQSLLCLIHNHCLSLTFPFRVTGKFTNLSQPAVCSQFSMAPMLLVGCGLNKILAEYMFLTFVQTH